MALVVKSRDEWRQFWLDNYSNRNPDADVGPNSYPWARASVMADVLAMQSNNAIVIAGGIPLDSLVGDQLDLKYGTRLPRILSTKSSGYVTLECGSSGTTPQNGDELICGSTKNRYVYTGATALHLNGDNLPVQSLDPGSGQNLDPGTVLQWDSPRAGCYATVQVWTQPNGKGITGGREKESDEEYRDRIRAYLANPVGHGNEGDLLVLIEESSANESLGRSGHGVPVQKGFVYPAIQGPGTYGCACLVKSDTDYGSRAPTSGDISTVLQYVDSYMPATGMQFFAVVLEQPGRVCFSVTLDSRATQWEDIIPWPPYVAPTSGHYVVISSTDAKTFTIGRDSGSYAGAVQPSAGNVFAVLDRTNGTFRRKTIQSFTGTGPWAITVDTSGNASDTSYTPVAGQTVCPWFDGINDVAAAVFAAAAKLGPGEMTAWDPQDGKRMMRIPLPSPADWPQGITARMAFDVVNSTSVIADATLLFTENSSASVGNTAAVYLLTVDDIGIFKS